MGKGQYQEWMEEEKKNYTPSGEDTSKKIYDNTVGYYDQAIKNAEAVKKADYLAAEQTRADIERQADVNRERAITDAASSYAVQTGAYGANAENIARGGLSGSGYADYLNSQAYATQRGEIQGARAISDATKAQAVSDEVKSKAAADATYAKNLDTYEAGKVEAENLYAQNLKSDADAKRQTYFEIWDIAETGEKTPAEIINMAQRFGLGAEDIDSLAKRANDKYIDNISNSVSANPAAYSDQYFTELADIIGTKKADEIKSQRDTATDQILGNYLLSGDFTNADKWLDELHNYGNGVISTERYNALSRRLFDAWHSALNAAGQTDEAAALKDRFMTKTGFKEYYKSNVSDNIGDDKPKTVKLPYRRDNVIQNDRVRSIGGVTYRMDESSQERDEQINKSINRRSDTLLSGEVAKYNGNYYVYDVRWRKVVEGQEELEKLFG